MAHQRSMLLYYRQLWWCLAAPLYTYCTTCCCLCCAYAARFQPYELVTGGPSSCRGWSVIIAACTTAFDKWQHRFISALEPACRWWYLSRALEVTALPMDASSGGAPYGTCIIGRGVADTNHQWWSAPVLICPVSHQDANAAAAALLHWQD